MDVRDMSSFEAGSFDAIIDKGSLFCNTFCSSNVSTVVD